MNAWVVRGLGMALIHVFVRVILGVSITQWPLQGTTLRWFALLIVILFALVWAGIDGIRDRRSHPDPGDSADLTMLWLKASLLAGIVAGVVSWLVNLVPSLNVTQNTFFFEITSGAAFTVLLVFVPAMLAVFLGRFFVEREAKRSVRKGENQQMPRSAGVAAAAGAGAAGSAAAAVTDAEGYAQGYPPQGYDYPADTGYTDPDAETTSFEPVHDYREDTSDLADRQDTSDLGRSDQANTPWQAPADLGTSETDTPRREQ